MKQFFAWFNGVHFALNQFTTRLASKSSRSKFSIIKIVYFCLALMLFMMSGIFCCYNHVLQKSATLIMQLTFLLGILGLSFLLIVTGFLFGKLCRQYILQSTNEAQED